MFELDSLANAARRAENQIYAALVGPRSWPGDINAAFVDAQNALNRLRDLAGSRAVAIVLDREHFQSTWPGSSNNLPR